MNKEGVLGKAIRVVNDYSGLYRKNLERNPKENGRKQPSAPTRHCVNFRTFDEKQKYMMFEKEAFHFVFL